MINYLKIYNVYILGLGEIRKYGIWIEKKKIYFGLEIMMGITNISIYGNKGSKIYIDVKDLLV